MADIPEDGAPTAEMPDGVVDLLTPDVVRFDTTAVIFPFGMAAFVGSLARRGLRCDAIYVDEEGGVSALDLDRRDWFDVIEDKPKGASLSSIPTKQ